MSDDPFQRRLDTINREMADLLQQDRRITEQESPNAHSFAATRATGPSHRDPLDGAMQSSPGKRTTSPSDTHLHHHAASTSDTWARPLAVSSQDLIRREVQQAVSREVKGMEDGVREMVQREWDMRVRELDAVLRTRFQELKVANDGLSKVVLDVAESFQAKLDELAKRIEQCEADGKRSLTEIRRELASQHRSVQIMGDVVADVEAQMRADSRSVDQRVEVIVKRHGENARLTMNAIDEKVLSTQRELEALFRESRKQLEGEADGTVRLVNRLQASVEASGSALERAMQELQSLGEGVAANQSGLRSCRSDVNRLEITLRSSGGGLQPSAATRSTATDAASSPLDLYRMQQDIFALKECVAYLHSAAASNGATKTVGLPHPHQRAPAEFGDDDDEDDFYTHHHGAHVQRRHPTTTHHQKHSAAPLNVNALSRPPYIASTRSTPTKSGTQPAQQYQQRRSSVDQQGGFERDGSAQWSDGGNGSGQAVPSPTYRTVPDSDSEDERENSKLARSELD
jgi:hypothetical protein